MTDNELLNLAAKAANFEIKEGALWNPLVDDGDALRLAIQIGMTIECSSPTMPNACCIAGILLTQQNGFCRNVEPYSVHQSPEEATRRAITRVAAAIGKLK